MRRRLRRRAGGKEPQERQKSEHAGAAQHSRHLVGCGGGLAGGVPGVEVSKLTVGAVCVYHAMVGTAVEALAGTDIPVAAVSTGFPAGHSPTPAKLAEIEASVATGAREIDIVISRRHVLTGDWRALYDEMAAFRAACGPAHVKAILATGELGSIAKVAKASTICMMAGADFIKTSTGKEPTNATLPVSLVMVRAIRDRHSRRLAGKSPDEVIAFYRAAGEAAMKDVERRLKLRRRRAG